MGLDMYLYKVTYVGAMYEHNNVKGVLHLERGEKQLPIKFNRISVIKEQVGYWRKANAIHKWFVDNIQEGKDDCKAYEVSKESLKTLRNLCREVLDHPELATEKLPPHDGFFFGSTETDEGYLNDLESTIQIIDEVLSEDNDHAWFEYRSSW